MPGHPITDFQIGANLVIRRTLRLSGLCVVTSILTWFSSKNPSREAMLDASWRYSLLSGEMALPIGMFGETISADVFTGNAQHGALRPSSLINRLPKDPASVPPQCYSSSPLPSQASHGYRASSIPEHRHADARRSAFLFSVITHCALGRTSWQGEVARFEADASANLSVT